MECPDTFRMCGIHKFESVPTDAKTTDRREHFRDANRVFREASEMLLKEYCEQVDVSATHFDNFFLSGFLIDEQSFLSSLWSTWLEFPNSNLIAFYIHLKLQLFKLILSLQGVCSAEFSLFFHTGLRPLMAVAHMYTFPINIMLKYLQYSILADTEQSFKKARGSVLHKQINSMEF